MNPGIHWNLKHGKQKLSKSFPIGSGLLLFCTAALAVIIIMVFLSSILQVHELPHEDVVAGIVIEQHDPRLFRYIRKFHLTEPPTQGVVDTKPADPQVNIDNKPLVFEYITKLLGNQKGGFFIECGANDGEFLSNTLPFELRYGWTGLLIESDPVPLKRLRQRNRKAWIADVCLSTKPYPEKVEMRRHVSAKGLSYIPDHKPFHGGETDYTKFTAQCFPLYSILKAIGVTTIDFFSLDIEGAELPVLKTVPWSDINIKTLSIEVHPDYAVPVKEYMQSVGYTFLTFIQVAATHDQIYIRA